MQSVNYNNLFREGWINAAKVGPTKRHQRRLMSDLLRGLKMQSLLDVGCGDGINLQFFSELFPYAKLYGLDISEEAVNLARQRHLKAEFFVLDVAFNRLDHKFDLLTSIDVLEHIPEDRRVLKNMYEMTRPGGHALITTLKGNMRAFEKRIGHVRNYKEMELEKKIREAGYIILKRIEWGFPFYSPLYRNFLNFGKMNERTFGEVTLPKFIISEVLYFLFFLNFYSGDIILILAQRRYAD